MHDSAAAAEVARDTGSRDIAPFLAKARDEILESLMADGVWPPSPGVGKSWRVEVDIACYVNTLDGEDSDEFIRAAWVGDEARDNLRLRHEEWIGEWLDKHQGKLIRERAEHLSREAEEEAEADERDDRVYRAMFPEVA